VIMGIVKNGHFSRFFAVFEQKLAFFDVF